MAQPNHSELINQLKEVRVKIIKAFAEKQGIEFDCTTYDIFDSYIYFGLYSISFDDILLDIFTNQKPKFILQYLDDCENNPNKTINYQSYCMGLRFDMVQISKPKN